MGHRSAGNSSVHLSVSKQGVQDGEPSIAVLWSLLEIIMVYRNILLF